VISQVPSGGTALPGTTIVITVSTGVAPKPVPVLGQPDLNTEGFGEVKPTLVYGGGDPTSAVQHITWTSWGGAHAVGHGKAAYAANSSSVAESPIISATIVAWDLGMYQGHYMYRKVSWYFPQYGESFSSIENTPYKEW
jgi:hypothetical protein